MGISMQKHFDQWFGCGDSRLHLLAVPMTLTCADKRKPETIAPLIGKDGAIEMLTRNSYTLLAHLKDPVSLN